MFLFTFVGKVGIYLPVSYLYALLRELKARKDKHKTRTARNTKNIVTEMSNEYRETIIDVSSVVSS